MSAAFKKFTTLSLALALGFAPSIARAQDDGSGDFSGGDLGGGYSDPNAALGDPNAGQSTSSSSANPLGSLLGGSGSSSANPLGSLGGLLGGSSSANPLGSLFGSGSPLTSLINTAIQGALAPAPAAAVPGTVSAPTASTPAQYIYTLPDGVQVDASTVTPGTPMTDASGRSYTFNSNGVLTDNTTGATYQINTQTQSFTQISAGTTAAPAAASVPAQDLYTLPDGQQIDARTVTPGQAFSDAAGTVYSFTNGVLTDTGTGSTYQVSPGTQSFTLVSAGAAPTTTAPAAVSNVPAQFLYTLPDGQQIDARTVSPNQPYTDAAGTWYTVNSSGVLTDNGTGATYQVNTQTNSFTQLTAATVTQAPASPAPSYATAPALAGTPVTGTAVTGTVVTPQATPATPTGLNLVQPASISANAQLLVQISGLLQQLEALISKL